MLFLTDELSSLSIKREVPYITPPIQLHPHPYPLRLFGKEGKKIPTHTIKHPSFTHPNSLGQRARLRVSRWRSYIHTLQWPYNTLVFVYPLIPINTHPQKLPLLIVQNLFFSPAYFKFRRTMKTLTNCEIHVWDFITVVVQYIDQ